MSRAMAGLTVLITVGSYVWASEPSVVDHAVVYREEGRYAGWPANSGIWSWDDEIVVGFTVAYLSYTGEGSYPIDRQKPRVERQARSTDGGKTWTIEVPSFLTEAGEMKKAVSPSEPVDFKQPNFAMRFQMKGSNEGESSFLWSNDRCKTWNGPFTLPMFSRNDILARTDYLIEGQHEMLAFLTSSKDWGREGWPFCARTTDGGVTWDFVSWIGDQPKGTGYSIMPTTVRLSDTELYTYIRCRRGERPDRDYFMQPYRSMDNGLSWELEAENRITGTGNPVHMIKLKDGRLALTYGFRGEPYSIRARLSSDGGKTWTPDIFLRKDGVAWDLGYTRTVQRADGKIVTCYYFNTVEQPERFIGATIWDPGTK